ncbi:Uncharacterised protein [Candidatus Bartonella washoeensis]|uniref:Uncharacterized protein n=2 Tax=Candidatus Bartonella washoeensis TaxID=186739 RepID=J0ZE26_9HYPH|nr:hypothetical protein MCQ_01102 [Bartonella washoeensis Sb944nv]EJF86248.1 hypothetical protein MCW_00144 [Bartonella washoeensis 085-0475]SPU27086.1 Uncharacterised protein [Bartonella washoeensis]
MIFNHKAVIVHSIQKAINHKNNAFNFLASLSFLVLNNIRVTLFVTLYRLRGQFLQVTIAG